jgi:hypothetical protein
MGSWLLKSLELLIVWVGIATLPLDHASSAECPCPSPEPLLADFCRQLDHMEKALHDLRKRDIHASSFELNATFLSLGHSARNLKKLTQLFEDVILGKVRYDRLDAFLNDEQSEE